MSRIDVPDLHWTDAMFVELPETNASVDVSILDGGRITGASSIMHADCEPKDIPMGCWVFYISHPKSGKKVLWDVGISAVPFPVRHSLMQGS